MQQEELKEEYLKLGDEVEIVGLAEETRKVVVTGVEMFRKLLDEAQAGDNIGALLRGVQRTEIERGQVLAKPGISTSTHKILGQKYTYLKKKKVEDIHHSSMDTDHNSISEQQTLQENQITRRNGNGNAWR